MVEARQDTLGDGNERPVQYAKFREDKPAQPGYTKELISVLVPEDQYDSMVTEKAELYRCSTVWDLFQRQVSNRGNTPFLGSRHKTGAFDEKMTPVFGPYEWLTFNQINITAKRLAAGIQELNLCP